MLQIADFESEIRVYSTSLEAYSPALIAGMLCISLCNILSLYICLVYMKMFFRSILICQCITTRKQFVNQGSSILEDKSFKIKTPATVKAREAAQKFFEWCLGNSDSV